MQCKNDVKHFKDVDHGIIPCGDVLFFGSRDDVNLGGLRRGACQGGEVGVEDLIQVMVMVIPLGYPRNLGLIMTVKSCILKFEMCRLH